ncbi:MAG: ABC transporter permease [Actinobacteria bacterium]|nr:ABC transporter permease [Actinomycetota bacterium]
MTQTDWVELPRATEAAHVPEAAVEVVPPDLSPWRRALRRFASHRPAVAGLCVLLVVTLSAIFAPWVAAFDPASQHLDKILQPPDSVNWFGTDQIGRDVFSRVVFGARVSLSVGVVAVAIYLSIAIVLGSLAGMLGGRLDNLIMRFTDLIMTTPTFILILIVAGLLGPNIVNIMVIIGIFGWPGVTRLIRGQILLLRELDYVAASRVLGTSTRQIVVRHVLPNVLGPITVAATLGVAGAMLGEAGLSFLGVGVTEPIPSWGSMVSYARGIAFLAGMPWMWLAPGLAISLTILSINFIGDGLRDAFDVRGGGGKD